MRGGGFKAPPLPREEETNIDRERALSRPQLNRHHVKGLGGGGGGGGGGEEEREEERGEKEENEGGRRG